MLDLLGVHHELSQRKAEMTALLCKNSVMVNGDSVFHGSLISIHSALIQSWPALGEGV
jgi:hypothetical protein